MAHKTTVVSVAPSLRPANTYEFTPAQTVPANLAFAAFLINLQLADKLATGITLAWQMFFSSDNGATWVFAAQGDWLSYGPGGYIRQNIDGTTTANPDPEINVPLGTRAGQKFKGVLILNSPLVAGVTITIQ